LAGGGLPGAVVAVAGRGKVAVALDFWTPADFWAAADFAGERATDEPPDLRFSEAMLRSISWAEHLLGRGTYCNIDPRSG
jgi:hypothetical protein